MSGSTRDGCGSCEKGKLCFERKDKGQGSNRDYVCRNLRGPPELHLKGETDERVPPPMFSRCTYEQRSSAFLAPAAVCCLVT